MGPLLTTWLLAASALAGPPAVDDAAAAARRDHPELAERIEALQPIRTRAGHTMLPTDADPRMAPVHLALALRDDLPEDVRIAHARLGAEAGEPSLVRTALDAGSPAIRASLHTGLQRSQDPAAADLLVAGLDDADAGVRTVALSVLSRHATASAHVDALARAAVDANPEVRRLAVRGLGWHGSVVHTPVIERAVQDADAGVREAALGALRTVDTTRALELAPVLLTDPDARVRRSAERLLR
jgi:HEAT repeat protein